ncbi:DUF930 domain-containing protein [Rhizobium puerariae]|uniref:DUF930 domain-containing protein n=2 Tax=Rhizobium puerariae TaxID=1585791 RepID=A0ABV6ABK5_9HYPH
MADEHDEKRSDRGWGIPASILIHAVFAGALFFHLPLDFSEPQKEESVSVEIVPPPEEAEQAVEKPKPEEAPKEEAKKEEPPPPEQKPEEAQKEAPPPSPQPPEEEAKQQPEPPPPAQQEEAAQQPPPGNEQGRGQPLPVLRPVFEFGEKDSGPRKSEAGNAPQEAATPPAETRPDGETAEQPKSSPEEPVAAETPPANPVPDDVNVPEVDVAAANPQRNDAISETLPDSTHMDIVTPPPAASATKEPSKAPVSEKPAEMTEAKTLFSQSETGDVMATTAMGNVPRGVRAGQLCATELREQLRHASPSYRPELLPAYRLPKGTVLEVKRGAFRASAQWYDLSFRCEVNEEATRVLSFAFDIGAPVPQGEWRKRGFPEF